MLRSARDGFVGLVIGVAGGVVAGMLLAPKRRGTAEGEPAIASDNPGNPAATGAGWLRARVGGGSGLMPDEKITEQLHSELARQGRVSPRVDITTIDGVVYLRGRESDPVKADGIVAVAHDVPGVVDVIDEVKREA